LTLTDLFDGEDALREKSPPEFCPWNCRRPSTAPEPRWTPLTAVREALIKLDKTLAEAADNASSKMQHQLETLRGRAARAELRQERTSRPPRAATQRVALPE
jgi:hypothetical protein